MSDIFNDKWGRSIIKLLDTHWTPADGLRTSVELGTECLASLRSRRTTCSVLREAADVRAGFHTRQARRDEFRTPRFTLALADKEAAEALLEWQREVWLDECIASLSRALLDAELVSQIKGWDEVIA